MDDWMGTMTLISGLRHGMIDPHHANAGDISKLDTKHAPFPRCYLVLTLVRPGLHVPLKLLNFELLSGKTKHKSSLFTSLGPFR